MEIFLIRHTSVDVPKGTCYGQTDVPLSRTFVQEATAVKTLLDGMNFDAVYCSPLSRCRQLAMFCVSQQIIIDRRLLEINFGQWEMRRFDEIDDPHLHEWYADFVNVRATGGESFIDQNNRFRSFIEEIKTKGYERIAVFTHGGILMQAMLTYGLATLDNIFERQPEYGAVLRLDI